MTNGQSGRAQRREGAKRKSDSRKDAANARTVAPLGARSTTPHAGFAEYHSAGFEKHPPSTAPPSIRSKKLTRRRGGAEENGEWDRCDCFAQRCVGVVSSPPGSDDVLIVSERGTALKRSNADSGTGAPFVSHLPQSVNVVNVTND